MPIYEYECTSCCNVFEIFQRMTEDPLTSCPDCSGPVKKLVSMSSFQLKGSGWYADGYSSKSSNGSGSSNDSTTAKSVETKTESTATKTEKAAGSPADSPADSTPKNKKDCPAAA